MPSTKLSATFPLSKIACTGSKSTFSTLARPRTAPKTDFIALPDGFTLPPNFWGQD